MPGSQITEVFAVLPCPVREVIAEITKPDPSADPIVRAILDEALGHVGFGRSRPADRLQEHIMRLSTDKPLKAIETLRRLPGVERPTLQLQTLVS